MTETVPQGAEISARVRAAGSVATIGTFDGVHRGHRALIDRVVERARALGLPAAVVTFDPHPAHVLRPERRLGLLTPGGERVEAIATTGADYLLLVRFDERLAGYSPARFVDEVLLRRLRVRHLVIGHDHAIGKDRSGDAGVLTALGRDRGFDVEVIQPVSDGTGIVSSSAIRRAIVAGDVEAAARGLGRPYSLRGTVARGDGRGRHLGFPTANLDGIDQRKLLPPPAVYAARAVVCRAPGRLAEWRLDGLLHLGERPTFGDSRTTVEFFAFDFDGDLYGATIDVQLCRRLRGIETFDSADTLVRAMHADAAAARALFSAGGGACEVSRNTVNFKA